METYTLLTERDRKFALAAVVRAKLGAGMEVSIKRRRKNREQEKRLHACLADIADQIPWPREDGEMHSLNWWKRRATLGWLIDEAEERAAQGRHEKPEIIISLDGQSMALFLPGTSDLDIDEYSRLIEWTTAFGTQQGVVWTEPKREDPPPRSEAI